MLRCNALRHWQLTITITMMMLYVQQCRAVLCCATQEVVRPVMVETTALGSAVAAGLAVGVWSGVDDPRLANVTAAERSFTPVVSKEDRDKRFKQWMRAVERSIGWAMSDDDPKM
jgi:glycerol kinase